MLNPRQQEELKNLKDIITPLYLWNGSIADFISSPTPLTSTLLLGAFNNSNTLSSVASILGLASHPVHRNYFITVLHKPYLDMMTENQMFFGDCKVVITESDAYTKPTAKIKPTLTTAFSSLAQSVEHIAWTTRIVATDKAFEIADVIRHNVGNLVSRINRKSAFPTDDEISELLTNIVAIGMLDSTLHEYIASTLHAKYSSDWETIESYFVDEYKMQDSYFQSFAQLGTVSSGDMTLDSYLKLYGDRAFDDYELSSPRFREIPHKIQEIVRSYRDHKLREIPHELPTLSPQDEKLLHTAYKVRGMRGAVRLRSLKVMSHIRKVVLHIAKEQTIPEDIVFYMTKIELLQNPKHHIDRARERKEECIEDSHISLPPLLSKKSLQTLHKANTISHTEVYTPVSRGIAQGKIKRITSEFEKIDVSDAKCILVFPDSSPRYSHLYPYAAGIIFETGGIMSHGAIVAREYKKPAITLGGKLLNIPEGKVVELNGTEGSVKLLHSASEK